MYAALQSILQSILVFMGRVIVNLFLSVSVSGLEHIPRSEALILVSNHFSWFDGPLLMIFLPFRIAFLLAIETERVCFFRFLSRTFNLIPIWRGQVDRKALRAAEGGPEGWSDRGRFPGGGGIDPALAGVRERGERIEQIAGHTARHSAKLIRAQSGIGLLATQAQTRLLPVAVLGRRKDSRQPSPVAAGHRVRIRVGHPFGPMTIADDLPRRQRRQQLDALGPRSNEAGRRAAAARESRPVSGRGLKLGSRGAALLARKMRLYASSGLE